MQKVILDTNMLLVPGQFKVDIFSELERVMECPYEIVVLQGTVDELEKIMQDGSKDDRRAAKLAMMLLDHQQKRDFSAASSSQCKGLKMLSMSGKYVDDAIVEIAEDDTLVATNDGGLKRRLLESGVRVIYLKQDQYLRISA